MTDRLHWWEDIPLGLALIAQSYVVGLWYYGSIHGASWQIDMAVAIIAGLALDLIVVTTTMGRRMGRSSGWSWATSFGAFACSSLIALDRYGWQSRSLLHVAFPLVVFLYSQHLATPRRQASQEAPGEMIGAKTQEYTLGPQIANGAAPVASTDDDPILKSLLDMSTILAAPPVPVVNHNGHTPDIVKWRDEEGLTYQEIGQRLGVSRQAAQQKYKVAKQ